MIFQVLNKSITGTSTMYFPEYAPEMPVDTAVTGSMHIHKHPSLQQPSHPITTQPFKN